MWEYFLSSIIICCKPLAQTKTIFSVNTFPETFCLFPLIQPMPRPFYAKLLCHAMALLHATCRLHASLYCSLTRLSSHAVTLNEVDELKKPQSSELVWLWLSGHVQKEHSLAWRLAVARLPDFGRCYDPVVEVVVPAWWLFQQRCLSCGQGLVGRCPSLCTRFESFIGAVVHSNPLSTCSSLQHSTTPCKQ